jgi:hypothetical protein
MTCTKKRMVMLLARWLYLSNQRIQKVRVSPAARSPWSCNWSWQSQ